MKLMPLEEVVSSGLLQELNRIFLHPIGLALIFLSSSDSNELKIVGFWDERDDPEGIIFADEVTNEDFEKLAIQFEKFKHEKHIQRLKQLGYIIQPRYGKRGPQKLPDWKFTDKSNSERRFV